MIDIHFGIPNSKRHPDHLSTAYIPRDKNIINVLAIRGDIPNDHA